MGESETSTKPPWSNGYWRIEEMPNMICIIDGEKMDLKVVAAIDYPDLEGSYSMSGDYGNFGKARKEIVDATGADEYNFVLKHPKVKFYGVVNESGTEIKYWSYTNSVDTWRWMSPQEAEKLKENLDHFDTPRLVNKVSQNYLL